MSESSGGARGPVVVGEGTDLLRRPRLLSAELIAREGQDHEPTRLQLGVQRLELTIVRVRQTSPRRYVDDE